VRRSFAGESGDLVRYGFIGLGHLGHPLAASLLRGGFDLTVHDLDQDAARDLISKGARWAATPRELAAAVDAVITCLPSPVTSSAVLTGENGVLKGLRSGGTWIEMSTTDQREIERVSALAAAQGVATLAAPVTGGVHRAAAGEITVLVGGERPVFETHLPALQAMGGAIFYIGDLSKACVLKVITNMLAFIHLVAAGEALMLARRAGLDLAQTFAAIKASSGNSFVHETETMDLACKDLGFAYQYGRDLGVPLEIAGLTEQIFRRAREQYGGGAWSTQVVKLLEDALHTDLRAPGFPAALEAGS
jgi:3-hydroxyisobutyrate dehydrogenase